MTEATIEIVDGEQRITCGPYMFRKGGLYKNRFHLREFKAENMDELYAVLHAREVAKQWHKAEEYLHGVVELAEKNGM